METAGGRGRADDRRHPISLIEKEIHAKGKAGWYGRCEIRSTSSPYRTSRPISRIAASRSSHFISLVTTGLSKLSPCQRPSRFIDKRSGRSKYFQHLWQLLRFGPFQAGRHSSTMCFGSPPDQIGFCWFSGDPLEGKWKRGVYVQKRRC